MAPWQYTIRVPAAVLLFLAVWEAGARVDDAWTNGAPLLGLYDQSILKTTDEFGIAGSPHARYLKWKMNSLGFRGPELERNRERILCIGASETFGLYEPEGQEYPAQLEREVNRRIGQARYQVVNGALPGQSLSSFARRASKVIREVRPAVTVLYPSLAIYIDPPPAVYNPGRPAPMPKFRLRIAGKIFTLLTDVIPVFIQTGLQRLQIRAQTRGRTVLDRIPESSVLRFQSDMSEVLDILEDENVRPVLVTHATRFGSAITQEDRAQLTAWRSLYPTLKEAGFSDMEKRLNDVIRDQAVRRNLTLVDAPTLLHGAGDFVEFVHFTPSGAQKLANAVADAILPVGKGSER